MIISELQVMKSAAGWYVGKGYQEGECWGEFWFPYSRESEYYSTEEGAKNLLALLHNWNAS